MMKFPQLGLCLSVSAPPCASASADAVLRQLGKLRIPWRGTAGAECQAQDQRQRHSELQGQRPEGRPARKTSVAPPRVAGCSINPPFPPRLH